MSAARERLAVRLWYSAGLWYLPLLPFSLLFAALGALRRRLYRSGWRQGIALPLPVIVVGNISVGGTGKTPVTIWLANELRRRGFRPGIVSRGYGGSGSARPIQVHADSDPAVVGDEPVLLAERSACPVVVHKDRLAAARVLLDLHVDVVIADDGLQHYRLRRDYEIAVVDALRGFGNGHLLPAGPLREPPSRLAVVDHVLVHQASSAAVTGVPLPGVPADATGFHLAAQALRRIDGSAIAEIDAFRARRVHAVAGIGNPERFFTMLESLGFSIERHAFPDHAELGARDIAYDDDLDIVMTEKDAVKCRAFATERHWYLPVDVNMHDTAWLDGLENRLRDGLNQGGK